MCGARSVGRSRPTDEAPPPVDPGEEPHIERLLQAYSELLPAVNTLVGHHFTRTLIRVALDHVDQVGSDAERRAIGDRAATDLAVGDSRPGPASGRRP